MATWPKHDRTFAGVGRFLTVVSAIVLAGWLQGRGLSAAESAGGRWGVVDLSLLVSPKYPCVWPSGMTPYQLAPTRTIGPGAYNRDVVVIDEHTGTQFDAPAHFVPPPDSGLPGAGPMGKITGEKVDIWRFVGEACVIDCRDHVDAAPPGESFLIMPEVVLAWEQKHRRLGPGDVVLFRSGYTDRYYRPFPEGERFVSSVLDRRTPGWPAPAPETMKLLGERQVWAAGTDGASMGPVGPIAVATHQAGGQYGLVWTECATDLGALPETGALHAIMANKHVGGSGGEARALAITEPKLAAKLLAMVRAKRVADLSVLLDEDLPVTWPGEKAGLEGARYLGKTLNAFDPARGPFFARMHILDSQAGTHLVTPSYSLPPDGFDNARYAPEVREALAKYESRFGKRGTSDVTVDKVALDQLLGPARVIDVRDLVEGSTAVELGKSPAITLERVRQAESKDGPIAAGDVVIFRSGYSDRFFKPLPAGDRMMVQPLAGKAAGWPTPELDVITYLANKGVRLIGTDGPTLGGVDAQHAMDVYWLTGSHRIGLVEYLIGLDQIPTTGAFFMFGPIKLEGAHGAYGRAIALY
ncbi:MAG TPA: cyclase family protein [Pirellulales bacterium]